MPSRILRLHEETATLPYYSGCCTTRPLRSLDWTILRHRCRSRMGTRAPLRYPTSSPGACGPFVVMSILSWRIFLHALSSLSSKKVPNTFSISVLIPPHAERRTKPPHRSLFLGVVHQKYGVNGKDISFQTLPGEKAAVSMAF